MSTTAVSPDLKALDAELNQSILSGNIMEAFEKFYADDIVMQENNEAPRIGKEINRKAELDFLSSVQEFHGANLLGSAVDGNRSYSEWEIDATYKNGQRHKLTQVAVRQWKNGQVVHERFYYSK
jgi:ketosteroid isomerase-like protein